MRKKPAKKKIKWGKKAQNFTHAHSVAPTVLQFVSAAAVAAAAASDAAGFARKQPQMVA